MPGEEVNRASGPVPETGAADEVRSQELTANGGAGVNVEAAVNDGADADSETAADGDGETGTEVLPFSGESPAPRSTEPGEELDSLRPRESMQLIRSAALDVITQLRGSGWLAKIRSDPESLSVALRSTGALVVASLLFAGAFSLLVWIVFVAIAKRFHGFSISGNYPVHRIYESIDRYLIRITPPPGGSHLLLVYSVYLAVLPVLFAVVFMYLRVGSGKLVVATLACVAFMIAPFGVAVTSIRSGSVNCGSWIYPTLHSGLKCYGALSTAFRIAFCIGVIGIVIPVVYLIRGRQHPSQRSLLFRALNVGTSIILGLFVGVFKLIIGLVRWVKNSRGPRRGEPDDLHGPRHHSVSRHFNGSADLTTLPEAPDRRALTQSPHSHEP
jgi:hypothetical protein